MRLLGRTSCFLDALWQPLRAALCQGSTTPVPSALEGTAWNCPFHTQDGEAKAGAQGMEPRGFAHPTGGWGSAAPQIIQTTLALPADDKSVLPLGWGKCWAGLSQPWHTPSSTAGTLVALELGQLSTRIPEGLWSPTRISSSLPGSSNYFSEKSFLMGNREGRVGSGCFWILFFLTILRGFSLVAFDLVHILAAVTKALLQNFLHLQFIAKCLL